MNDCEHKHRYEVTSIGGEVIGVHCPQCSTSSSLVCVSCRGWSLSGSRFCSRGCREDIKEVRRLARSKRGQLRREAHARAERVRKASRAAEKARAREARKVARAAARAEKRAARAAARAAQET